jgi:hypothetical protein
MIKDEEDEDEPSLTEDQPQIASDETSPEDSNDVRVTSSNVNAKESSPVESPRPRNLKDADVQTMIDQVMEQARQTNSTEDEIQLLKLKLEEVRNTVMVFYKIFI